MIRFFFFSLLFLLSLCGAAQSLRFVQNKGQWPEEVQFRSEIPGGYLFALRDGFIYSFYDPAPIEARHARGGPHARRMSRPPSDMIQAHAYKVTFEGADRQAHPKGLSPLSEKQHFFIGDDPRRWASDVSVYEEIVWQALYPGIGMRYYLVAGQVKYDLLVRAGADLSRLRMRIEGAESVSLRDGQLHIQTSLGEVIEKKPVSFQGEGAAMRSIPTEFVLEPDGAVRFAFPQGYRADQDMVIDPALVFSSFSGSIADNWGFTATPDPQGRLYAGGIVFGAGFPTTVGAFQVQFGGQIDVSVIRFDSLGRNRQYALFLGGNRVEVPSSLIVNQAGQLVILGTTSSQNMPKLATSYDTTFNGGSSVNAISGITYDNGSDLFVAVLSPNANSLVGFTYIGGSGNDGLNLFDQANISRNYGDEFRGDVITDAANNIYVVSSTPSANFPIQGNVPFNQYRGQQDGVVFKLSPNASQLLWSTFLGGSNTESVNSVKLDAQNNVVVGGGTNSNNFPVTAGVLQSSYAGGTDGFVTVLAQNGTTVTLSRSTFLGTGQYDQVYLVDIDGQNGQIGVLGQTSGNYPVTPGRYNNPNSGQFIHKISSNLQTSIFSTRIGAGRNRPDICPTAFLINECGNILLSGWGGSVNSEDEGYIGGNTTGMPTTTDAFQRSTDGDDFYLMSLSADGTRLIYGSFFGGNDGSGEHVDGGTSRFDRRGIVYHAVCSCFSNNYPTSPGVVAPTNPAFPRCNNAVFKFDLATLKAQYRVTPQRGCQPLNVQFTNTSQGGNRFTWDFGDGNVVTVTNRNVINYSYANPGLYQVKLTAIDSSTCQRTNQFTDTVRVFPAQFQVSPSRDLCFGDTVTITAAGGNFYRWSPATGLNDTTAAAPRAFPRQTTTYTVLIRTADGCETRRTLTITVVPKVTAAFEATLEDLCDTIPTVRLTNRSVNATAYLWDLGDGRTSTQVAPPPFKYRTSGTYTIRLTASVGGFCGEVFSLPVTVVLDPTAAFRDASVSPDQSICFGGAAPLLATGGVRYEWTPTTGLTNPNIPNPVATPATSTTYTVRIFNARGCSVTRSTLVQVDEDIRLDFGMETEVNCGGVPRLRLTNRSSGTLRYVWDFGDGNSFTGPQPTQPHAYTASGTYQVRLIGGSGTCQQILTKSIRIEQLLPPNVFSPNGDGKNETFYISEQVKGWALEVYNRWGDETLFKSASYQNDWDGSGLPTGTYFYTLTAPSGEICKGWVQILR